MKTAIWLYLFLFVAFFDLHAQYPILTPFALSLGAAPSFIGLMMGLYSITHLPGNLIAGYSVDRFGSRLFIVFSLLLAGVILLLQSQVTNPWQLLVLRSISGFVLAFLSPACMAMLAKMARNQLEQGKLMAGNGVVHNLASVVSPAAGAFLVAQIGFTQAFYLLGWILIVVSLCALLFLRNDADSPAPSEPMSHTEAKSKATRPATIPWLLYSLPVAMACAQGILSFELPLMAFKSGGLMTTGLLFSLVSLGSLITLSMFFLNRYSPYYRSIGGAVVLALTYFLMAAHHELPLSVMLLMLGMAKGVIFPALSSLLIELSGGQRYGRTFSILSIAFSIGAFAGPLLAGQFRELISPYFIAFLVLMAAIIILPFHRNQAVSARTHFT
ncbi:MFS transporter [Paenibacillus sp. GCM10012307]|uniref:MFS transporter n=1 Tax=Paenibacillus roseus TaxID=2798579 RepID=A0A934J8H2_9BACL|nr:MFS transporter [Paenibacillus roseus]MBJ6362300.1 MFS transporter [Paenibacillus roseus]